MKPHVQRHNGGNAVSVFREHGDGTCSATLHYRRADGSWRPVLPIDVALDGTGEPSRSIARSISEPRRPNWMLCEREPWRLR